MIEFVDKINNLKMNNIILVSLMIIATSKCDTSDLFIDIDLPENHLSQYFNNLPHFKNRVIESAGGIYKNFLDSDKYDSNVCWGYEYDCVKPFQTHECPGNHHGFVNSKEAQLDVFYAQADFGYVKEQVEELRVYCEPTFITDSSLECTKYARFCRGRNLMINFTDFASRKEPVRYALDVLKQGEIGGYCKFQESLKDQLDHVSALQSWAPELRNFEQLEKRPIVDELCDVIVDRPTFLMKIDATSNMYHHFCDFFNLYLSQHVNFTGPRAFSTDVNVLIWESYPYESYFAETFKAFTDNPIWNLNTFKGKVVCFRNLVLPLLPRMIFGLYYNTPIIHGCQNSALFETFSEHILHRLRIEQKNPTKIRITFLSRKTKYRNVLNEDKLYQGIAKNSNYNVKRVTFDHRMTFRKQLEITRNTDIFIGMHGAGLTHLLFLPKWATLFELYNCDDANCYKDLARLRGVNYITWEDTSKLEAIDAGYGDDKHAKFKNYRFDVDEFVRLVDKAAENVMNHTRFKKALERSHEEL